jgi:hypothetical protein
MTLNLGKVFTDYELKTLDAGDGAFTLQFSANGSTWDTVTPTFNKGTNEGLPTLWPITRNTYTGTVAESKGYKYVKVTIKTAANYVPLEDSPVLTEGAPQQAPSAVDFFGNPTDGKAYVGAFVGGPRE